MALQIIRHNVVLIVPMARGFSEHDITGGMLCCSLPDNADGTFHLLAASVPFGESMDTALMGVFVVGPQMSSRSSRGENCPGRQLTEQVWQQPKHLQMTVFSLAQASGWL